MSDVGGNAAAGWYPDPSIGNVSRYWDGSAWTDHTANPVGAAPYGSAVSTPVAAAGSGDAAKKWGVVVLIGGVLMALGALLPWETASIAGSEIANVKGTSAGSGNTVLVSGVVIGILAVLVLNHTVKWKASIATLVLSVIGLLLVSANASSIDDDIQKVKSASAGGFIKVEADTGIGLGLAIIGCLMALVGSILLMRAARKDDALHAVS